ncbi:hypothetical protein [Lacticaseibacillus sp. GG6-2]
MFEKFRRNWIRHKAIRQAKKDLASSGKTGLALFAFVQEYTGDPHPWIQRPTGFFNNYEYMYTVMVNQTTGSITLLYKD